MFYHKWEELRNVLHIFCFSNIIIYRLTLHQKSFYGNSIPRSYSLYFVHLFKFRMCTITYIKEMKQEKCIKLRLLNSNCEEENA